MVWWLSKWVVGQAAVCDGLGSHGLQAGLQPWPDECVHEVEVVADLRHPEVEVPDALLQLARDVVVLCDGPRQPDGGDGVRQAAEPLGVEQAD